MKTKTIYYHPVPKSPTSVESLHIPIKVDNEYVGKSSLLNCPVWQHQNSRTFTVYASSNLHLQIDKESNSIFSNNLNQQEFDTFIIWVYDCDTSKTPIVQIDNLYSNFYWTDDKDIWISILPHPLTALNNNFYHCGGWFNLSNWDRQVNIGAVVVDTNKPIIINRGDPLYNIKFHTKNHNDQFKLICKEIDYKRFEKMNKRTNFVLSKRLSSGFNYNDILFESGKESKCPFKFFWNK
jgi:hypothetical protein